MKLNELITDFEIQTSNEEKSLLCKLEGPSLFTAFAERDQFVLESLIRKSLVTKYTKDGKVWVFPNEKY